MGACGSTRAQCLLLPAPDAPREGGQAAERQPPAVLWASFSVESGVLLSRCSLGYPSPRTECRLQGRFGEGVCHPTSTALLSGGGWGARAWGIYYSSRGWDRPRFTLERKASILQAPVRAEPGGLHMGPRLSSSRTVVIRPEAQMRKLRLRQKGTGPRPQN